MSKFFGDAEVLSKKFIAENTFILKLRAPRLAELSRPGQFCEIKLKNSTSPFWRRPFSVSDVNDGDVEFMIDIVGQTTKALSECESGEIISVSGPFGNGFDLGENFQTAVIIAGGIGYAPFPFLIKKLKDAGKRIIAAAGFATSGKIPENILPEFSVATDDGTSGFHGNALQLTEKILNETNPESPKVFACGPTPMLRAVKNFFERKNIEVEISVETVMACGMGLCQGCVVERADKSGYLLACKDGPVFNSKEVII